MLLLKLIKKSFPFLLFQGTGNNGMAEVGVSQSALVEPREEGGRKLPQYIAALSGSKNSLLY